MEKVLLCIVEKLDELTKVMKGIRSELEYRNQLETDLREYHENYQYDSFRYPKKRN